MRAKNRERIGYIALGSNVGDRRKNMTRAVALLERDSLGIRVLKRSSIYETSPVGPKQRNFLNAAVQIKTRLTPEELLKTLQSVEKTLGRKRSRHWGPRVIDLDLLFLGQEKRRSRTLILPHPELARRKFVLIPLAEIAPRHVIPGLGKSALGLLRSLTDESQKVRLFLKHYTTKK